MHPAAPVRVFDFKYSVFRVFSYAFPAASLSSRMFFYVFLQSLFRSEIGQDEVCTDTEKEKVWNSLPECTPRNILVRVPFPPDPDTIQVQF